MATVPYWVAPVQEFEPPAELCTHADVVVVGGGVMGASVTYWLARAGVNVLLVEAHELGGAASGRNAGLCLSGASPLEASSLLGEVMTEEDIDAAYRVTGHLALASTTDIWRRVLAEVAVRPIGAPPLHALSRGECEKLLGLTIAEWFIGGRYNPGGALLHPWRLVLGLVRAARRRGARVAVRTPVHHVSTNAGERIVHTPRGRVACRGVVYACSAGVVDLVPSLRPIVRFTRGQMLATEPLRPLFAMGMAVDWGTVYWRQAPDGAVIIGGCREQQQPAGTDTRTDGIDIEAQAALEQFLPGAFPGLPRPRVARRWSGVMDSTPDGRPMAGALANGDWVLSGFAGHGLPGAIGFGKALCDSIMAGKSCPELEMYAPARFGLQGM